MKRCGWLWMLIAGWIGAGLSVAGCTTVKGACEACCKAHLKAQERTGMMSSQEAYRQIAPCVDECVDRAEDDFRDGYWVEKNQACK